MYTVKIRILYGMKYTLTHKWQHEKQFNYEMYYTYAFTTYNF